MDMSGAKNGSALAKRVLPCAVLFCLVLIILQTMVSPESGTAKWAQFLAPKVTPKVTPGGYRGKCSDQDLLAWAREKGVYADKITVADFAFEDVNAKESVWTDRIRWRHPSLPLPPLTLRYDAPRESGMKGGREREREKDKEQIR